MVKTFLNLLRHNMGATQLESEDNKFSLCWERSPEICKYEIMLVSTTIMGDPHFYNHLIPDL